MGKPSEKKQENRWKWWDDFKKRNDSKKKQENRWKWWNDEENLKSIEYYGLIDQEIHREHNLIANRMNWYVTSQSFLMAAFAISGNNNYRLGFLALLDFV
ncbi:hypothetical protein [Microcystis aeruginosa]|uniref:hypothetical protein n=1 Tax=Microcystis aeruginosa TaxID=1126 RepID=UPI000933D1CE|nr:hypothetical protein [Microcystis aeruginosa]